MRIVVIFAAAMAALGLPASAGAVELHARFKVRRGTLVVRRCDARNPR